MLSAPSLAIQNEVEGQYTSYICGYYLDFEGNTLERRMMRVLDTFVNIRQVYFLVY